VELRAELAQLEAEVTRLAAAITIGGDLPALVAALQERERRRTYLRAELAALDRRPNVLRDGGDVQDALDVMREALTDWRAMLRRELPESRRVLRALLAGRLMFAPGRPLHVRGTRHDHAGAGRSCRRMCKGCGGPNGIRHLLRANNLGRRVSPGGIADGVSDVPSEAIKQDDGSGRVQRGLARGSARGVTKR